MMDSKQGKTMLAYLPWYYEASKVMQEGILQPQGSELDKLWQALDEVLAANFVRMAEWGLVNWEQELGIVPLPTDSYEDRRRRIIAQLSWQATATMEFMENLLNRYTLKHSGRIVPYYDKAMFETCFDLDDITDFRGMNHAVELYKPAHLSHANVFKVKHAMGTEQEGCSQIAADLVLSLGITADFWQDISGCRWNAAKKWDGSIKWGNVSNHEQQHYFFMSWQYGSSKPFTEVRQNWNREFTWNGTRKWGRFLPSDKTGNVSAGLLLRKNDTVTEREIL